MRIRNAHQPLLVLGLVAAIFASASYAQDGVGAKVDDYVKAEMQKERVPGISLAVIKDGQIILAKGYGFANVELQVPARPETIYQSGSVGKQFTAMAIMMLVEEGKIGLDDKISKYFTDAPEAWKDITIRRLLTHTSGTTDYPRDFDFRRDYTEDELLKRAEAIPLAFQPGEKWSYSNLGYVTLGILIHKVSGKFYGDFLQERIFKPLGMTTARIISEADIVPNRAAGYRLVKSELKNQEWVSPSLNTTADGALYLTVYDMAKWDAALYTEKLVKKATLDQIWTKVTLNNGKTSDYGFGWSLTDVGGHKLIEHGGAWQGFRSHIARYVDDRLTVVVFANLIGARTEKIAHDVAAIYNPALTPPAAKAIEDKEPQVTAMMRDFLRRGSEGKLEAGLFTADFAERIMSHAGDIKDFLEPLGEMKSIELMERSEEEALRSYRYRVSYKNAILTCSLLLTKESKIAGAGLRPE